MKKANSSTSSTTTALPKLLKVEWLDAAASVGWETEPTDHRVHPITSIGWLTFEDPGQIILSADTSTVDGRTDTNRRMAIPKAWITSRKEIKL